MNSVIPRYTRQNLCLVFTCRNSTLLIRNFLIIYTSKHCWMDIFKYYNEWAAPQVRMTLFTAHARINAFYKTGAYADVIIRCEDREFKCHRVILAGASEYFDIMFNGHFREANSPEVVIHGIDSVTLEQVLRFVYEGDIADGSIDDENVFSLLRASDMFQLPHIQSQCMRYLVERSVPAKHALEIFSFVCTTDKLLLVPILGRFIMERLNQMSREAAFFNLSFKELSLLLQCYQSSSLDRERGLLDALLQWISRSELPFEEAESVFTELTQEVRFCHLRRDDIARYFHQRMTSGSDAVYNNEDIMDAKEAPVPELSLHVYINTRIESTDASYVRSFQKPQSNLFTLRGGNSDIDWSAPSQSGASVDNMRTVVVNDRLYSLKSKKKWDKFQFSSCPSADPSADTHALTAPFDANWLRGDYFNLMCSDTNDTIYVSSSHRWNDGSLNLFSYNCELDKWFSIATTGLNKQFLQTINITHYDGRIYLIGNGYQVQAYDHRAGKLAKLTDCSLKHSNGDECCSHKDRIYVSSARADQRSIKMEIYDPVADKWDIIETTDELRPNIPLESHRLLSFNNQLWMFSSHPSSIYVETYDSFLRKWDTSNTLHNAVQNRIYPVSHLGHSCMERSLTDVIAFKPV